MALGVRVQEFLELSELSIKVYQGFRQASKEYEELAQKVSEIHFVIEQIRDAHKHLRLRVEQETELKRILQRCSNLLEKLDTDLEPYRRLVPGTPAFQPGWAIARWQFEGNAVQDIGKCLSEQLQVLADFNSITMVWSLAAIKRKISRIIKEPREGSIIALAPLSIRKDRDDLWPHLEWELQLAGIGREVIDSNRQFFFGWIATALASNEAAASVEFDKTWSSPLESQDLCCSYCEEYGHVTSQCRRMSFGPGAQVNTNFEEFSAPIPVAVPSLTQSVTTASYSPASSTPTTPSKTLSQRIGDIGLSPNLANGYAPGNGPLGPTRIRPSESSERSRSGSTWTGKSTTASIASTEKPKKTRRGFGKLFSNVGDSSPSLAYGF
ncbi:MAG: hypothetical protein M1814_004089 [Vezdaea aestivalis]|nr:MAG: hypothetical protein M1814_004089 [Vezdaea aestivalis]